MLTPLSICLIACHGGPADHFATYTEVLTKQGYDVQIHATGPALNKFIERGIKVTASFDLKDDLTSQQQAELAQSIVKACSTASIIITDVGHLFDVKIHEALDAQENKKPHFAYYDNPEPFVPGGYSSTAAEVIKVAEGVLFANNTLAQAKIYSAEEKEIDFANKKRFGIGYYPVSQAEKIAERRKFEHDTVRSKFLMENGIEDKGQKVLVYFGGNNEEYFLNAFPAFLSFVAKASEQMDFKNIVMVIHQHPGAKVKNQDAQQVEAWLKKFQGQANLPKVILSNFQSNDVQVLADAAFYYQTSMGPQFVLEGIPTFQIGHEVYKDILVSNHLAPTATNAKEFAQIIENLEKPNEINQKDLLIGLGIKENWPEMLETAIKESISSK